MAIRHDDRLFDRGDWVMAPEGTKNHSGDLTDDVEVIARVPDGTEAAIDKAVAGRGWTAFDHGPWLRTTPPSGLRGGCPKAAGADHCRDGRHGGDHYPGDGLADLVPGPRVQAMAPSMIFNYDADLATTYAFEGCPTGMLYPQVLVTKEPVGVVGAIAPWNVPLFIAAAKSAPSLAAGCTVERKTPLPTPFHSFGLAEMFADAGLPKGVLSGGGAGWVRAQRAPAEAPWCSTGLVHGVRGRRQAHRRALRGAAEALHAQTGGKSAAIILDDPDLATTIPTLLPNAIMNNGQACIAQMCILAPRARLRRGGGRGGLGRLRHEGGRPDGPGDRGRPGGGRAAAEQDRGVSRQRGRRGRDWSAPSVAARPALRSPRAGTSSSALRGL